MYLCFCTSLVNSASDVFLQRHCVLHKDIVGVGFVALCRWITVAIVRGSGVWLTSLADTWSSSLCPAKVQSVRLSHFQSRAHRREVLTPEG